MEGMDGGSFTMSFNSSQPRGHNAAAVSDDGLILKLQLKLQIFTE